MPNFNIISQEAIILNAPSPHTPRANATITRAFLNLSLVDFTVAHITCFFNVLDCFIRQIELEGKISQSNTLDNIFSKYKKFITTKGALWSLTNDIHVHKQVAEEWLHEMRISEKQALNPFEKELGQQISKLASEQSLDIDLLKAAAFHSHVQNEIASSVGCMVDTTWQPNQPIDVLMTCIEEKGYLSIQGKYGAHYHNTKPTIQKIAGFQVRSLDPHSFNGNGGNDNHQVVVIGASKKGYANTSEDLVYFVDTRDNNSGNGYLVYAINYNDFCKRAYDVRGLSNVKGAKSYFFYHPDLNPRNSRVVNVANNTSGFWTKSCNRVTQVTLATACVVAAAYIANSSIQ